MERNIYIQILDGHREAYRVVLCRQVEGNIYEVGGSDFYNHREETWEFSPGTHVVAEEQIAEGKSIWIAIREHKH